MRASQVALVAKSPSANAGYVVRTLGPEDLLDKEMVTHSSYSCRESHEQRSLLGYSPRGCKVAHDQSDQAHARSAVRFGHWGGDQEWRPRQMCAIWLQDVPRGSPTAFHLC